MNNIEINQQIKLQRRHSRKAGIFEKKLVMEALRQSLIMLDPRIMVGNPVMFVTEIGAAVTTMIIVSDLWSKSPDTGYTLVVAAVLWLTVLFGNFAGALAEARGKAQTQSLKMTRRSTPARKILSDRQTEEIPSTGLKAGDIIIVQAGEIIPGDGEIIEGAASVDESAVTGESAPVLREAGGDCSGVTGGTRLLSDQLIVRITNGAGDSFLDRMIALVEGASRQKTPNETALTVTLAGLTLAFLMVTATLLPIGKFFGTVIPVPTLVALLVCLIPTTIGALLSAIGIAGMDRALSANILAKSGKAVELAGDIDTLLIDKTGTITVGNRQATEYYPLTGVAAETLAVAVTIASFGDQTPEGRSVLTLGEERLGSKFPAENPGAKLIPFSAQTRLSGVDIGAASYRKGSFDAISKYIRQQGGTIPEELQGVVEKVAVKGSTPLVVTENNRILGVLELSDILKIGIRERFARLRAMGLRIVMVTGDNKLTAGTIARDAGVDDFIAEARPEDKLEYIRREQKQGRLVAMMGDGTNDAPALAQADIGVAMNSGTQAAKEAGNMVDLDSDPTKLIEVIEIGKQLLMTRGALTTFSIANDMAKYFAIVPAMFILAVPQLYVLNVMNLATPHSAILSALIFNAVIIPLLIPVAIKGVKYRPVGADSLLRRNLLIYGLGGVILPFVGIKLIDMLLELLKLA
ncbi:MAG: potassium-transporting ATPase subunit KdpB [Victivallaceae bacterium]|jgi:K+-transporting ATPase ATPase B chain